MTKSRGQLKIPLTQVPELGARWPIHNVLISVISPGTQLPMNRILIIGCHCIRQGGVMSCHQVSLSVILSVCLLLVMQSRIRILDDFYTSLAIAEWRILADLLAFLIQSPADFHDTRRDNESTTFWQQSSGHPDPNPD